MIQANIESAKNVNYRLDNICFAKEREIEMLPLREKHVIKVNVDLKSKHEAACIGELREVAELSWGQGICPNTPGGWKPCVHSLLPMCSDLPSVGPQPLPGVSSIC